MDSNSHSYAPEGSSTAPEGSSIALEGSSNAAEGFVNIQQYFWVYMNDPIEAQIEEKFRAQIEAHQRGMSNQHHNFSRRHIQRYHESANKRVEADYFIENPVYNDVQFR
jgi:hypothetical protein